jgi:hypothetical protein
MEIEIFTLCDYAVDNAGKLTIVGTFDNVNVQTLPWQQMLGIAVRLRFEKKQIGKHLFELKIIDPNKTIAGNINGDINVMQPIAPMQYSSVNAAFNLGLQINSKGVHTIELYIDNEFKSGLSFNVI